MKEEERFVDFATVREMLLEAQGRRNNLTYEQKAALQQNGPPAITATATRPKRKCSTLYAMH